MVRHRVKGKDLASVLGISANAISALRNADVLPEISGDRWESLCEGINELSKIGETITPFDLIEYIPSSHTPSAAPPNQTRKAQNFGNRSK